LKITLTDVSNEADVFFQSMRLNRARNVWNVDVSLLNKSGQPLEGPLVLLVDSFTGTTGAQSPDGRSDDQPAKAFFDFTGTLTNGKLLPSEQSTKRTLTLGVQAGGSPKLTVKVFARPALSVTGLNIVRTLNAFGQPLPSVLVENVSAGAQHVSEAIDSTPLPSSVKSKASDAAFSAWSAAHSMIEERPAGTSEPSETAPEV
jgi:hypothetical protein